MRRLAFALAAIATVALLIVSPAFAQTPTLLGGASFVRTSADELWMIKDGRRHPITIVPVEDSVILAFPVAEPESWVSVARFEGKDDTTTRPFSVGQRWRIVYTITPERNSTAQICVDAENIYDGLMTPDFGCYTESGETYAYRAGTFYLELSTVSTERWSFDVQELIPS